MKANNIDKSFISTQAKVILFSINTSICIFLEFIIIKYIRNSLKLNQLNKTSNVNLLYKISFITLCVIAVLSGVLIFQQVFDNYYDILLPVLIISVSYTIAVGFIGKLSAMF